MSATYMSLLAWQEAANLAKSVYSVFNDCRDFGFKDQIQRASVSVMNNIAEGYARHSDKAFRNFLQISRGSCAETESMVYLAHELGYIDDVTYMTLLEKTDTTSKLLTGLIKKYS